MSNIIEEFENAQITRELPDFAAGDTIVVNVKVKEGSRERVQAFEGVCIARRNRGLHSAFTVRKMSYGTGVERVFQAHSPGIESVQVKRRGKVHSAKLYRLRGLEGKAARIKEDLSDRKGTRASADVVPQAPKTESTDTKEEAAAPASE